MDRASQVDFAMRLLRLDGYYSEAIGITAPATSHPGDHVSGYIAARLFAYSGVALAPEGWNLAEVHAALAAAEQGVALADAALRLAVISALKHGLELPATLRDFHATALLSPAARPSAHRNAKPDGPAREALIVWVAHCLINRFGLKATRNATSGPSSACDIIAEALGKIDRENALDYDNVRKIWARRDKISHRRSDLWGKKT